MALRTLGWGTFVVLLVLSAGCDWPLSSQPPASLTPSTGAAAAPTALTSTPRGQAGATSSVSPSGTESAGPTPGALAARGDVNLSHLNFLVEDVTIAGQPMAITHIYSESPRYEWVDASGEGIAALDDAARAAVVYLTDYERTGDPASLDKARRLLNFAMYLQADDGEFYNFITDRNGTINKTGNTSYKSSGWWAARGGWALALGYRVFKSQDAAYAGTLRDHFTRLRDVWARDVESTYGKFSPVHGINVPGWLIGQGADVTGIAVLALLEYDQATGGSDAATRDLLGKLCEGLADYQSGDDRNYPWGMHPDSAAAPLSWHAWGSTQSFALAQAGKQLNRSEWIESARREADTFYARLLAGEMVSEWGVLPFTYPQIAYGIDSMTQGLLALYQATGDDKYARMAGLAAGWFYGNNSAAFPMYDPATGRGYDGLLGPSEFRVNRNAGAESTIEALMALQAVSANPLAQRYLAYKPQHVNSWQVLEAETAAQIKGDSITSYKAGQSTGEAQWSNGHYIAIGPNDAFDQQFSVPEAGRYYLYAAYLRQSAAEKEFTAEALRAPSPPAIDGDLGEWSAAQPLSATSTANILRGVAGWGGADKDAFVGYLMWDEHNLYVAARVFDPEHSQAETGPSVWKGDTLWVYLDTNRDRSSVDAKLTLAQTPSGPQIWNWKANAFVRDAKLVWKQGTGSYVYEASLPWSSLGVSKVEVGKQIGLELGRGCCGSGFQDLSGKDPDTAANLPPLTLVEKLSPGAGNQSLGPVGPDAVALRWDLDETGSRKHSEGSAPDRDYLSLERLTSTPVDLAAGSHILRLEYAGSDPARAALIDGFLLLPARLTKTLVAPDEHTLTITYDIESSKLTLEEK
jgi:hypothetical protein